MWPFKKKSLQYLGDFQPIQRTSLFTGFGLNNFGFSNLYQIQQNNELLIYYFNNIAEVAAPIMKYFDGASQVKFTSNIPEVDKLLNNPNHYQGWDDFISLAVLYKRLLGNCIINGLTTVDLTTSRIAPKQLFLLTPQFTSITVSENYDWRMNTIKNYAFNSLEAKRKALEIDPLAILHLKEANPNFLNNQYYYGESRYCSCAKNIECISASYETKADLYQGPQLIITGKPQGEFGSANQTSDIATVQAAMKKYGSKPGQYKNIVTDIPLDVTKASFNVAELQLNENNLADFQRLCDVQNIDSKVFSDPKSSTYNNKKEALKDFYNNGFKSEMDGIFADLEQWLKNWWPNLELIPDYSGIQAIVEANIEENQRLLEDCKLGILPRNQYLISTGQEIESNEEFNELYSYNSQSGVWNPVSPKKDESTGVSQEQLQAQANLRGTVGGVEGILNIQNSVATGVTDYEAGVAILVEIYGFTDEVARRVLGKPRTINNGQTEPI